MKHWDIYAYQISGVREPHPAIVLGHVDRVTGAKVAKVFQPKHRPVTD